MEQNITKESIETLLSQVSIITKKYDDIAKITGENFNVFSILGLSTSEVRTHSRMLAELLNPKGSHAMEDVFLKLFVDNLILDSDVKERYLTATSKANVVVEKWIGKIDDNNDTGGFIDILIEFPNSEAIIIENKIYAGDQKSQLRRYYNYNKKATLIYLTLDGKPAENNTTQNEKYTEDVINPICLSYGESIETWLEHCKKEAVNHPLVRETITQYIYLIKRLTNQNMSNNMENEILNVVLRNKDNLKQFFYLIANKPSVQARVLNILGDNILGCNDTGLDFKYEIINNEAKYTFISAEFIYEFHFYSNDYRATSFGIKLKDNIIISPDEKMIIQNKLANTNFGKIENWDGFIWNSRLNLWESTSWEDVTDKHIAVELVNCVKDVLNLLK